jgi:hypothetical protein
MQTPVERTLFGSPFQSCFDRYRCNAVGGGGGSWVGLGGGNGVGIPYINSGRTQREGRRIDYWRVQKLASLSAA